MVTPPTQGCLRFLGRGRFLGGLGFLELPGRLSGGGGNSREVLQGEAEAMGFLGLIGVLVIA